MRDLTPYDTGEIFEPQLHPGFTGKVDFDNDESATALVAHVTPTLGRGDGLRVNLDRMTGQRIEIWVDGVLVATLDEE